MMEMEVALAIAEYVMLQIVDHSKIEHEGISKIILAAYRIRDIRATFFPLPGARVAAAEDVLELEDTP